MGQRSPAMQIPMWIVYAAPMVGFSLTSIRQVQILSYWFKNIFIKEEHHG
jgi:TRAP-type C4-dicarboxylate transport system permease small subunit